MPLRSPQHCSAPLLPQLRRSKRARRQPQLLSSSLPKTLPQDDSDFQTSSSSHDDPSFQVDDVTHHTPSSPCKPTRRPSNVSATSHAPTFALCSRVDLSEAALCQLRDALLDWYVDNYRPLPWRLAPLHRKLGLSPLPRPTELTPSAAGSPYAVWVSEVMSQQTRLSVVEAYFARWMVAFPDVHALAAAPLERINELWAGLGYYRRARFLHEGAKQVVDEYGGKVPGELAELRKLKGVGRYTAGAIASIAFGKRTPLVDGNVERVFARICPGLTNGERARLPAAYWELADKLVADTECPGDLNQALMEFGATVCKPRAVQCETCPVQGLCGAHEEAVAMGQNPAEYVVRYPVKDPKKVTKVRDERVAVLVVCMDTVEGRKFLLVQRPKVGLLAGLWEAPNGVVCLDVEEGLRMRMDELEGVLPQVLQPWTVDKPKPQSSSFTKPDISVEVGEVTHVFSHIRQRLAVRLLLYRRRSAKAMPLPDGRLENSVPFRWLSEHQLGQKAVSTQMKKVFAAALAKLPVSKRTRQ